MIREQIIANENWRFPSAAFSSFYQRKWRFPFKYLFLKNKNKYKLPVRFTKFLRKRNYLEMGFLFKWSSWSPLQLSDFRFKIAVNLLVKCLRKCCFNKHSLVHGTCDQTNAKGLFGFQKMLTHYSNIITHHSSLYNLSLIIENTTTF